MLFISVEDFLTQASAIPHISRDDEKALALRMADGDDDARKVLVQSQFPLVAALIQRAPREIRTLKTVYECIIAVEKGVDNFDFLKDSETFAHHLGWRLRQVITRCIAERF